MYVGFFSEDIIILVISPKLSHQITVVREFWDMRNIKHRYVIYSEKKAVLIVQCTVFVDRKSVCITARVQNMVKNTDLIENEQLFVPSLHF